MIPFFTFPYEDEILYSTIARYHYYSGNVNFKDTLWELFGSRTIIPSLLFPSRLGDFASKVSWSNFDWEHYLENNTMFPFYAPFMPKNRFDEVKLLMRDGDGKGIYTKVGFVAGGLCKTTGLKYCPICVTEDITRYGEPYFHRTHQLQGILFCPKHSCLLKKYPILLNEFSRIGFILLRPDNLDLKVEYETEEFKLLTKIAQAGDELGKMPLLFDIETVQKKYLALLSYRGLITPGGRIKQRLLYRKFVDFYGEKLLKRLDSMIDENVSWLETITRKPRKALHPIRHLLLICFLCDTVTEFFQNEPAFFSPFGEGPWFCLNRVANHYKNTVVSQCKVTSDSKTRVPVGTFSCSCGFVYSRKGPDLTEGDKFKIGKVKQYGEVWEAKLRILIESGNRGLRQLAKIMGCDPKTIVVYATKLNLLSYLNTTQEVQSGRVRIIKPSINRTVKSGGAKKNPTMVRKLNRKRGVDWKKRDKGIVTELKEARDELVLREKPVRITRSILGRNIGKLSLLEHYLHKLPNTRRFLDCQTESVEEFQLRRIRTIHRNNLEQGLKLKEWELVRLGGIKRGYSMKVEQLLSEITKIN